VYTQVEYHRTKRELLTELSESILNQLKVKKPNDEFNIVLTGGSLSTEITDELVRNLNKNSIKNSLNYPSLHFWLTDERFVERNSKLRNDVPIEQSLANLSKNYSSIFHPIISKEYLDIHEIRELYERELEKHLGHNLFDVVIVSLSKDGHIASIFDKSLISEGETKRVQVTTSPSHESPLRLSLSNFGLAQTSALMILSYIENPRDSKLKFFNDPTSTVNTLIRKTISANSETPVVIFTNENLDL
jgi:6-phosphogluconolactonase/glucosamine-6-phosphate isomerase/deaminase